MAAVNRDSTPDEHSHPTGSPSIAALSPAGCPVRSTNPPPALPLHAGDAAMFIADVTLPDCTHVDAGQTMAKVWRLKNAGTVPWKGYSLRRLDLTQQADQCQTISDVPIKDTKPGEMVDIRTDITTPRKPGLCYVRFKMVDASGTVVFPGSRPINFQIIVDAP
ncbi:NBR1-Ig-like domain-containing protein [Nonomuraea sp. NPDC026600]|uniref:NBR1-Ig-like domain-containing protein n=1 Tax=Nonomuraea sp. NPDC026600 TaxID=3155363 RepID=UPI0033C54A86